MNLGSFDAFLKAAQQEAHKEYYERAYYDAQIDVDQLRNVEPLGELGLKGYEH